MNDKKHDLVVVDEAREHNLTLEDVAATIESIPAKVEDHQLTDEQKMAALAEAKQTISTLTEAVQKRTAELQQGRLRKQAAREFKDWKRALMEIIRTKSELVFRADGTYQFVLPPRLVKLVWTTTIKERVVMERRARGEEGAEQRAMDSIRGEVAGAVEQVMEKIDTREAEEQTHATPDAEPGVPA